MKKISRKKTGIAVAAIVILILSVLICNALCKSQTTVEYPKITVMFSGSELDEKAVSRVSEAISEITREKIGCEVELKGISGSYKDKMRRALLGGGETDVYFVREIEDMQYILSEEYARNLTEEIEQYPVLKQAVQESAWGVNTESAVFSIPDNKDQSYYIGFVCRENLLDDLQIDESKIYSMEELHEILTRVKENHSEITPVVSHLGEICESIGEDTNGDGIAVLTRGMDGEYQSCFENFYNSAVFWKWCTTMYQWRTEGLLEEYMTQNIEPQTIRMEGGGFGYFARVKDYVVGNNEYLLGEELKAIRLSEDLVDNTMNPINWCVSARTEYPQEAAAFLNLLFTDEEINRLCRYGQEGIDYSVNVDGRYVLRKEEKSLYKITSWVWPVVNLQKSDQKGCRISPAYGFLFDSSQVREEMDLCGVVVQKYREALLAGELNPELGIPKMNEELKAAGVDEIIEEKQKQFEEYQRKKIEE